MNEELTIEELLNFHGRGLQMKRSEVKHRTKYLLEFLDLPPANTVTKCLRYTLKRIAAYKNILVFRPVGCDEQSLQILPDSAHQLTSYKFLKSYLERVL